MQSLEPEYIELLADKKLKGTITPEEHAVLEEWLNREPSTEIVWDSDDEDEHMLRERLLKRIKADAGIVSPAVVKGRMLHRYRLAAAAVLFLVMGSLTGYFLFFSKDTSPMMATSEFEVEDLSVPLS